MRISPANIQVIGDQLAILWNDSSETFIPIEYLRRACPCATCGGEPDVMGNVERPQVSYDDRSFRLKGWQLVGSYALQPSWEDGHATGLYTFAYLKNLEAAAASAIDGEKA